MKGKILDALKAKFEGVSDAILDRVAAKLAKTVTNMEDVDTAVAGVTFQQVLESYGDSRATDAQKTAVANYERKHGLKDGQRVNGGAPQDEPKSDEPQDDAAVPSWAKQLLDANKSLQARLDALDGERTATTRRGKIDTLLKDLPEELRKPYFRIDVAKMSDDEFNSLIGELPDEIAATQKQVAGKQAVFGRPRTAGLPANTTANGKSEATAEEAAAVVDKLRL